MQQKTEFTTKHRMLRATHLHKPRNFYTYAVGDVGDIQKVWFSKGEGESSRMLQRSAESSVIVQ